MDVSKEIAMKQQVLSKLKDFLMGEESKKFKPKAVSVEMIGDPKESIDDESPMEDMGEGPEADEEDDVKKGKMSLKDFLASRE